MDNITITPYTECIENAICATDPYKVNYPLIYGAATLGALSVTALAVVGIGYYCYRRWWRPVDPAAIFERVANDLEARTFTNEIKTLTPEQQREVMKTVHTQEKKIDTPEWLKIDKERS